MLTFEEALSRILALAPPPDAVPRERVSLDDAHGRTLAEEIASPIDLPAFDYSAMDGYAVAMASFEGNGPYRLDVVGESKTGKVPDPLVGGKACRIFTGAEIPAGADAVVMQERVERTGDAATFAVKPVLGGNIRRRGEDLTQGSRALGRGTRLRTSHVGLAATVDRAWLEVGRRPTVTIIGTGDELRAPGSAARPGTIPESNGVALRAMARHAGAIACVAPFVGDDRAATERAFDTALRSCDLLVTVGGVSVGDHDLVRPALEAIGVTLEFWRVAIKPGKPLAVGRRGDTIVLGLPGNPASAMVTFALFGLPLLRALQGDASPTVTPIEGRLTRAIEQEAGRTVFMRASIRREDGVTWVTPLSNQASGAVTSMAGADALLRVPPHVTSLAKGASVDVLLAGELGL